MYRYRRLSRLQQSNTVRGRRFAGTPIHAPPRASCENGTFFLTAATYEHRHHFPKEEGRAELLEMLLSEVEKAADVRAWVVLPNHYHLLVTCKNLKEVGRRIGRVHGRTAHSLNRAANAVGRQIWYRFSDRRIRSDRHYYASLNYIHYNPVKHGYVKNWTDWQCSSIHAYLARYGSDWLASIWRQYPVEGFGKEWDIM